MTTAQLPSFIEATIHQDALSRVPSFFNATTREALNELLQNARRSGATRIDITLDDDALTVSDDGRGISDPTMLLSFGQTGWTEKATQGEHPAGMGLYALARRDQVNIRSKSVGSPEWQVSLTPDHFTGKLPAPIDILTDTGAPTGTTVTLSMTGERLVNIHDAVNVTAKYHTLPVYYNGEPVPQEDFLGTAVYIHTWEEIRIGVYNSYPGAHGDAINFHGIVVRDNDLPGMKGIKTQWRTHADVHDCPYLELTLPARKELVQTPFLDRLRTECRRAIYMAISTNPTPVDMPKSAQDEAATMGIIIPDAAPRLQPWTPETARDDAYEEPPQRTDINDDTLVVDLTLPIADQQVLDRALENTGIRGRLSQRNQELEGYRWYDRLTKITQLDINVRYDNQDHDLQALRKLHNDTFKRNEDHLDQRPDSITLILQTTDEHGTPDRINLSTDVAFENEEQTYENRPLVTKDADITPGALSSLMMDAFFNPRDDMDSDSYDTQEVDYEAECDNIAITMLSSKNDAVISAIATAFRQHVNHLIPRSMTATITGGRGGHPQVTLAETPQDQPEDPEDPEDPES